MILKNALVSEGKKRLINRPKNCFRHTHRQRERYTHIHRNLHEMRANLLWLDCAGNLKI